MNRKKSLSAACELVSNLEKLGYSSQIIEVPKNEWLTRVKTSLGLYSVYANSKGKITILTNLITDKVCQDKANWILEQISARACIQAIVGTSVAYTDGSGQNSQCGWAMVLFGPDGKKSYEKFGNLGAQKNGQIAGEVEGSICAISDGLYKGVKKLLIRHDYEGVGNWGNGVWKHRDKDAERLKRWVSYAKSKGLVLSFEWTRGHNGDAGNERADLLAGKATILRPSLRIPDPPDTPYLTNLGRNSQLLKGEHMQDM